MKHTIRYTLLALVLSAVALASGGIPPVDVIVSDASGKVAFKGAVNAHGTFATGNLQAGNYVVQFNSKSAAVKGNQYALVISAGKKKVSADGVSGEKLSAGGVAMKVDVGAGLKITGQIAKGQLAGSDPNVKIINGKRYVWVGGETGSNLGGRWVEEGSPEARNVTRMNVEEVRKRQDHGDAHQEGFPAPAGGR